MAKGLEGITLFKDSVQVSTLLKKYGSSPSFNIIQTDNGQCINHSDTPEAPIGGRDWVSWEPPFPLSVHPLCPTKLPKPPPLAEYLPVLGVMKKALVIAVAGAAIYGAADVIKNKNEKVAE